MRDILFPFQEDALAKLHNRIRNAHNAWAPDNPQVISFSAPTGAGKTVIATALFEDILVAEQHVHGILGLLVAARLGLLLQF